MILFAEVEKEENNKKNKKGANQQKGFFFFSKLRLMGIQRLFHPYIYFRISTSKTRLTIVKKRCTISEYCH